MKFFYRYVNGLKEPLTVSTDIDPAMLGEILHDIMKNLYSGFVNKLLISEKIELIIRDKQSIARIISNSINKKFSSGTDRDIEGSETIVREVLMTYVLKILQTDKLLTPFRILDLEANFSFPVSILSGGSRVEVMTGGTVDRIDLTEGVTRIVDYKTGSVADAISSIDDLFLNDRKKDTDCWLQTLLYCEACLFNNPGISIRPSVYKIRKLASPSNTDKLKIRSGSKNEILINDYQIVRGDYIKNLEMAVTDIFSRDEPFTMTNDITGKCSWCPYKELCIR
jgi:hypothetical protein